MATMDGNSICYSALHCLFNSLGSGAFFKVGYCCFAEKLIRLLSGPTSFLVIG